jgi:hypothetical protein
MHFRWLKPYKVKKAIPLKGTYILKKLNDAELNNTVAGNRLKRFYFRPKKKPEFTVPAIILFIYSYCILV